MMLGKNNRAAFQVGNCKYICGRIIPYFRKNDIAQL